VIKKDKMKSARDYLPRSHPHQRIQLAYSIAMERCSCACGGWAW
jgi:hypothetical protein